MINSIGVFTSSSSVPLAPQKPLLILDADEVLLQFVQGFEQFLAGHECYLDLGSYRLHGNVRRRLDKTTLIDVEVTALLDEFRTDLDSLAFVGGAQDAVSTLSHSAQIVILSNIAEAHAPGRARNLASFGVPMSLLINSGSKGAAVADLARRAGTPAFFVDDIPQHLASAAKAASAVYRIHLIGDDRLRPLLPAPACAHLCAQSWSDVRQFIEARLKGP